MIAPIKNPNHALLEEVLIKQKKPKTKIENKIIFLFLGISRERNKKVKGRTEIIKAPKSFGVTKEALIL